MKIININKIKKLFLNKEAIKELEKSFVSFSMRKIVSPPPFAFNLPNNNGEICVKTALIKNLPTYAIKLVSVFKSNTKIGKSTLNGTIVIFDSSTGQCLAILNEQGWLTNQRTACAGTIADKYFRKQSANSLGLVGCGQQGKFQLSMILGQAKNYNKVYLWNRTYIKAKILIKNIKNIFPKIDFFICRNLIRLVNKSDTIITTTSSTMPLLTSNMIKKGVTIISVGADMPEKCEIDPKLIKKMNKIFVDSIDSNLILGDISRAIKNKVINKNKITGEIGEVINKNKIGRVSDSEKILVKLVGIGIQDTAIGNYIFQKMIGFSTSKN